APRRRARRPPGRRAGGSRRRGSRARSRPIACSPAFGSLREELAPARVAPCDLRTRRLGRRPAVPPADERVPERRPADREPDEAGDARGRRQPRLDLRFILAPPEHDATDAGAAGSPCRGDDGVTVLRAVEALDLPDVGFDAGVLELVDRVDHVARPPRPVVRPLVAVQFLELRLLRRHEELEHELPPRAMEILGEVAEACHLAAIHRCLALRVVAHEDLAEGGRERLDMARVIVAVLEIELVLATLLGGGGGEKAPRSGVAEDRGAELLVDEETGAFIRHPTRGGCGETVLDDRPPSPDPPPPPLPKPI